MGGLRLGAVALLAGLAWGQADAATPLDGYWLTQDRDGIMRVWDCGGALCVEIAGVILDQPSDPTPEDWQGVSQCHLPLVTDARPDGPDLWKGHITDPRDGKVWGVEISQDSTGDLALHGYVGIPLFGETQTWTRYPGQVPDDCRMSPGEVARALSVDGDRAMAPGQDTGAIH